MLTDRGWKKYSKPAPSSVHRTHRTYSWSQHFPPPRQIYTTPPTAPAAHVPPRCDCAPLSPGLREKYFNISKIQFQIKFSWEAAAKLSHLGVFVSGGKIMWKTIFTKSTKSSNRQKSRLAGTRRSGGVHPRKNKSPYLKGRKKSVPKKSNNPSCKLLLTRFFLFFFFAGKRAWKSVLLYSGKKGEKKHQQSHEAGNFIKEGRRFEGVGTRYWNLKGALARCEYLINFV